MNFWNREWGGDTVASLVAQKQQRMLTGDFSNTKLEDTSPPKHITLTPPPHTFISSPPQTTSYPPPTYSPVTTTQPSPSTTPQQKPPATLTATPLTANTSRYVGLAGTTEQPAASTSLAQPVALIRDKEDPQLSSYSYFTAAKPTQPSAQVEPTGVSGGSGLKSSTVLYESRQPANPETTSSYLAKDLAHHEEIRHSYAAEPKSFSTTYDYNHHPSTTSSEMKTSQFPSPGHASNHTTFPSPSGLDYLYNNCSTLAYCPRYPDKVAPRNSSSRIKIFEPFERTELDRPHRVGSTPYEPYTYSHLNLVSYMS
jgi:hypothetical protein